MSGIVFITATFAFGEWNPMGPLHLSREAAQRYADGWNAMCAIGTGDAGSGEPPMRVLRVVLAELEKLPVAIREFVAHHMRFLTRTYVRGAGDKPGTFVLVHPLMVDRQKLNEGDAMIQFEPPNDDAEDDADEDGAGARR